MTQKLFFDIAIIGGGAAGLMAAVTAAKTCDLYHKKRTIAILEAAPRIGKKLLATGNGRCNLSNSNMKIDYFHGDTNLIRELLQEYSTQKILDEFSSFGLVCREEEGRIYPYNVQASAVLEILRRQLEFYHVEILCDFAVESCTVTKNTMQILSKSGQTVETKRVILATGGKASPQLGSDGSGFALAKTVGHTITPLFPALIQLKTSPQRAKPLKGMRSYASATLLADEKMIKKEVGEVQFTENGLSGICIFQLSRLASEYFATQKLNGKPCKKVEISLDLMPEYDFKAILNLLFQTRNQYPDLAGKELLSGILNQRVGQEVMKYALPNDSNKPIKIFHKEQLSTVVSAIKDFRFQITGTMPWQSAQVTAGGVSLKEVNIPEFQSKLCPNLYFAGEILNIDGDCGGYNLHWAWLSGMAAGKACSLT